MKLRRHEKPFVISNNSSCNDGSDQCSLFWSMTYSLLLLLVDPGEVFIYLFIYLFICGVEKVFHQIFRSICSVVKEFLGIGTGTFLGAEICGVSLWVEKIKKNWFIYWLRETFWGHYNDSTSWILMLSPSGHHHTASVEAFSSCGPPVSITLHMVTESNFSLISMLILIR